MLTIDHVSISCCAISSNTRLHNVHRRLFCEKVLCRNCSDRRIPARNRLHRHSSHNCCGHKPEYRCREERPWIFLPSLFRLPASGSTTWKYQSVGGYRKSDLLGVNMSVEVFQLGCQHISQYGRSQTCGVGVDEKKQRVRA